MPLARRPLFPGFFVPVSVTCAKLVESLQRLRNQGTPYVGAFLLKEQDPVTTAAAAAAASAAPGNASAAEGGGNGGISGSKGEGGVKEGAGSGSADSSVSESRKGNDSSGSSSGVPAGTSIEDRGLEDGIVTYPPSSAISTGLMEELERSQEEREGGKSVGKEGEGEEGKIVGEASGDKAGEGGGGTQGFFGEESEGVPQGKELLKRMHEIGTFAQVGISGASAVVCCASGRITIPILVLVFIRFPPSPALSHHPPGYPVLRSCRLQAAVTDVTLL